MPFTDSGWSMVVAVRTETSTSMWIFLQPLTTSLWLASLAFFCFTGFVVWAIEHRINPKFRGTPWQQFGLIFYFAFSTLVFSHSMRALIFYVRELQRIGAIIGYQELGFDEAKMRSYKARRRSTPTRCPVARSPPCSTRSRS